MELDVFDDGNLILHRHTTTIINNSDIKSYVFKTLRIVHVTDGIADWKIGSTIYTIVQNDIIILNNIEVRQFYPHDNEHVTIDIYEFTPSSFYYVPDCQNIFYNRGANFRNVIKNNAVLTGLLAKIDYELAYKPQFHKSMISGSLITFLLNAARIMNELQPDSVIMTNGNNSSEYAAIISRAANYINNNLTSDLNAVELAKLFNMSSSYFSKMFKKYIGAGVIDYINMCRLNNVNRILANTDCTIIEAAFGSGYKTSSNFYRALKKYDLQR